MRTQHDRRVFCKKEECAANVPDKTQSRADYVTNNAQKQNCKYLHLQFELWGYGIASKVNCLYCIILILL